jgi:hypothetical protein
MQRKVKDFLDQHVIPFLDNNPGVTRPDRGGPRAEDNRPPEKPIS